MKSKLKITAIALLLCFTFILGACSTTDSFAKDANPLSGGIGNSAILIDKETGVNYIVVKQCLDGGISITPRLNADGTLFISK